MDSNTVLETYYDHYKDTYNLSKAAQSRRNKNFVILCILEALSFLMIRNPDFVFSLLNEAVRKELETTIQVNNSILQTLLWVLITYVLIRYVQDVLYVERQYGYLDTLEHKISKQLGEEERKGLFNREGDQYLKEYPKVLNIIDLFYKFFSPILFTVINVVHIISEKKYGVSRFAFCCDMAIFIVIIIITWFYFFYIHSKITAWFLKCPPIKGIADKLQNWLREV